MLRSAYRSGPELNTEEAAPSQARLDGGGRERSWLGRSAAERGAATASSLICGQNESLEPLLGAIFKLLPGTIPRKN